MLRLVHIVDLKKVALDRRGRLHRAVAPLEAADDLSVRERFREKWCARRQRVRREDGHQQLELFGEQLPNKGSRKHQREEA